MGEYCSYSHLQSCDDVSAILLVKRIKVSLALLSALAVSPLQRNRSVGASLLYKDIKARRGEPGVH
eukprot:c28566_g1_i1 orf=269-466(+)